MYYIGIILVLYTLSLFNLAILPFKNNHTDLLKADQLPCRISLPLFIQLFPPSVL